MSPLVRDACAGEKAVLFSLYISFWYYRQSDWRSGL